MFYPLQDPVAGPDPVHLEEHLLVGRRDAPHRPAAEGAQPDRRARGRGGARDGDLTLQVDGLHTRRGDDHREGEVLAQHGSGLLAVLRQVRNVRPEPQLAEGVHIVVQGDPALRARDQSHVDGLGQALLRPALRLLDRLEPLLTARHLVSSPARTTLVERRLSSDSRIAPRSQHAYGPARTTGCPGPR